MNTVTALEILPAQNMRLATDVAGVSREIVLKTAIQIQGRKYVRVEGWMAIATAHGCIASSRDVEKVDGGYRAIGEIRRMADGVLLGQAEGFVGEDEPTWFGGEMWSRKNNRMETLPKRADYAIRCMAQTRAISRVCRAAFSHVVVLMDVGLSTTPAEEVPDGGFQDVEPVSEAKQSPFVALGKALLETDEQKLARFLALFANLAPYATEVFRRNGLVLDTEDYDAISPSKVASFKKAQVDTLLEEVKQEAGVSPDAPDQEALPPDIGNIIVPVPRKGMKRDDYLKSPDTIGSLYAAASDDEEAARRLFGLVGHWQPSGWVGKDGKQRPPSQADLKFREALDRFAEWRESKEKQ